VPPREKERAFTASAVAASQPQCHNFWLCDTENFVARVTSCVFTV